MEPRLLDNVVHHVPIISTAFLVFLAAIVFPKLLGKNPAAAIPFFGAEIGNVSKRKEYFTNHGKKLYQDGYKKFKDTVGFRVTTQDDDRLVISPKFLTELRNLPDNVLSFEGALEVTMEKRFLKIPSTGSMDVSPHIVKADLTPALTRINPVLSSEVDETVVSEIGACEDWTPININYKLLRMVAIISGRIFIGPEICHNETYIDAAINYSIEIMKTRDALKKWHPLLRRFVGYVLPEVRSLRNREKTFANFLRPVILERQAAEKRGEQVPDDMLQWMIRRANISNDAHMREFLSNTDHISEIQLSLTFAAIHTTTLTATNTFYNLVAHPECVAELRAEIRTVLAAHNGVLTFSALQQLRKLDSVIKESLRMDPIGEISFMRKVLQPFTLSDGTRIPADVHLEIPAGAIARDPAIYPDPLTFHPFRFAELRDSGSENGSGGGAARNQFVSVTQDLLTFGYGRHACPGRFFAANEIKMILARTLQNYDMKMKDGETGRFPNLMFGMGSVPDPTKEILFRAVEI